MPSRLPSGRYRARVRHPTTGVQTAAHDVIGGPSTYADEQSARDAERRTRLALAQGAERRVTARDWWQTWTTDSLWQRPAESTNLHNAERTRHFVERYGDRAITAIDDLVVAEYLRGGANVARVPALRAMFGDATRVTAGRLIDRNPFAGLRLRQSRGRRDTPPPGQDAMAAMLATADKITPPSFAGYLAVATYVGARPGELDGLKWTDLDFQAETIAIDRQWNVKVRKMTLPKHNHQRVVAMTEPARERLLTLPRESDWVFTTLRGHHYTPSTRNHHWNRVRCSAGLGDVPLYLATRHYFGWYAWNVLGLDPRVIAEQLGHQDGGELVRLTYGHSDAAIARDAIRAAYRERPAAPQRLRAVGG